MKKRTHNDTAFKIAIVVFLLSISQSLLFFSLQCGVFFLLRLFCFLGLLCLGSTLFYCITHADLHLNASFIFIVFYSNDFFYSSLWRFFLHAWGNLLAKRGIELIVFEFNIQESNEEKKIRRADSRNSAVYTICWVEATKWTFSASVSR